MAQRLACSTTSGAMYTGVPLRERSLGSPGQCLHRGVVLLSCACGALILIDTNGWICITQMPQGHRMMLIRRRTH